MATNTSRLGLVKPSGSNAPEEPVDITQLNDNSDRIDQAVGCFLVNDGITPATGDLYDGAIVKERTSGIIWEARKNGGGTFDKVYIRYPLVFEGYTTGMTIPNSAGWPNYTAAGIGTVTTAACKNTDSSDVTSGRFVFPVKGIYTCKLRASWAGNATGVRGMTAEINNTFQQTTDTNIERGPVDASGDEVLEIVLNRIFNVGNTLATGVYQTSGGNLSLSEVFFQIALIEPIQ